MRIRPVALLLVATFLVTFSGFARQRSAPSVMTLEIEGVVKSVSSSSLVVTNEHGQDVTLTITTDTIFRSEDVAIAPTDLKTGDRVEVKAAMVNNVLNALVVNRQAPEQQQPEPEFMEINGVIKSISSSQIVVTDAALHDTTIAIDGNTQIFLNGHTATAGDLAVGDRVEVKASVSGTTLTAVLINAEAPETENEDVDVSGTVSAVGSSQITVTTREHGDVMVNVDSNTQIRKGDQTIAIGDIHVGDKVEAQGTRVDSHTILAREIEVQSSSNGHDD